MQFLHELSGARVQPRPVSSYLIQQEVQERHRLDSPVLWRWTGCEYPGD